jgi:sucrose phosphorylase
MVKILGISTLQIVNFKVVILQIVEQKRSYLGQMDVNAKSPLVWDFYEETLKKLNSYGCNILSLRCFCLFT